eukprot:scaffold278016_cov19-Prasinocladus_malaysianus.AAC.1
MNNGWLAQSSGLHLKTLLDCVNCIEPEPGGPKTLLGCIYVEAWFKSHRREANAADNTWALY